MKSPETPIFLNLNQKLQKPASAKNAKKTSGFRAEYLFPSAQQDFLGHKL